MIVEPFEAKKEMLNVNQTFLYIDFLEYVKEQILSSLKKFPSRTANLL